MQWWLHSTCCFICKIHLASECERMLWGEQRVWGWVLVHKGMFWPFPGWFACVLCPSGTTSKSRSGGRSPGAAGVGAEHPYPSRCRRGFCGLWQMANLVCKNKLRSWRAVSKGQFPMGDGLQFPPKSMEHWLFSPLDASRLAKSSHSSNYHCLMSQDGKL